MLLRATSEKAMRTSLSWLCISVVCFAIAIPSVVAQCVPGTPLSKGSQVDVSIFLMNSSIPIARYNYRVVVDQFSQLVASGSGSFVLSHNKLDAIISVCGSNFTTSFSSLTGTSKTIVDIYTITVPVRSGVVSSVSQEPTCSGSSCDLDSSLSCNSNSNCVRSVNTAEANSNSFVMYLAWSGTDSSGLRMTSINMIPQRFLQWTFGSIASSLLDRARNLNVPA